MRLSADKEYGGVVRDSTKAAIARAWHHKIHTDTVACRHGIPKPLCCLLIFPNIYISLSLLPVKICLNCQLDTT